MTPDHPNPTPPDTCPHCGAEGEPYFSRLEPMGYYWNCCGKPDSPEDIVEELHKLHEELAALREELATVTKERDEARATADQWRECARKFAYSPTSDYREALALFDKLEADQMNRN